MADDTQRKRADALFKHHARRWTVELIGLELARSEFHRGFLRRAALSPAGEQGDSPGWRSVEQLDLTPGPHAPDELLGARLERLRVLNGVDRVALERLNRGPLRPTLKEVRVLGPNSQAFQQALSHLARFRLETLTLTPQPWVHHAARLEWLFSDPLLTRLQTLRFAVDPPWDVAGLQGQLVERNLRQLRLETSARGATLRFDMNQLELRFDDTAALTRNAQTLRNLVPKFTPFPYSRVAMRIAAREATVEERRQLALP